MLPVFNTETLPPHLPSIFLAGPTPRSAAVPSWRPEALHILETRGFAGAVIIPEDRDFKNRADFDYADQIIWERRCLSHADVVVFWVPRHLTDMPAFTTNIEFGLVSERDQPFVLGYPVNAPKMRYLAHVAAEKKRPVFHTLEETLTAALTLLKDTVP